MVPEYNASFRHKRIIGFDDNIIIGTYKGHQMRKALLTPTASLHEKYLQTTESEKQHFSLLILSNLDTPFHVEYDERRIVSPLTSAIPMPSWNKDFRFYHALETKKTPPSCIPELRKIGEALLIRYTKKNIPLSLTLRDGYFWSDVLASLPHFKNFVVTVILNERDKEKVFDYEDLIQDYRQTSAVRGIIPHWGTFINWMASGFMFYEIPLFRPQEGIGSVNHEEKIFTVNPQLVGYLLQ